LKKSQEKLIENAQLISEEQLQNNVNETLLSNYVVTLEKAKKISKSTQPLVHYKLHSSATILPKICEASNGLDIPLQDIEHFQPHELKKVNLKIKFQIPKNHCALLLNKSSARTKYNVNIQLGLIDIGYHDYVIAVIQNMTNKHLTLMPGIAVAQLLILPAKIPKFENDWPLTNSDRGSFGSTGQNFQRINSTNYCNLINHIDEIPLQTKEGIDSIPFQIHQDISTDNPVLKLESQLNPTCIHVNNIKIRLTDTPCENWQAIYDFQKLENKLLDRISPTIVSSLPCYQTVVSKHEINRDNIKEDEQKKSENQATITGLFPKHYTVPITPDDLSHLLAADLMENKKLTINTLVYLQNMDPHIAFYKEKLLHKQEHKNLVLKRGVLCKINKYKSEDKHLTIYLPSVLLYPTLIYVHKYFLHPSRTQTLTEFFRHYYHPQAETAARKIIQACLTCSLSRNPQYRLVPVGKERTVNPHQPREAISMDILYMPKSSHGHTHALLIADLFSMYISFFPLKTKSSASVATALRSYLSLQGVPRIIYSDNDPSFRNEVENLLVTYNIQHCTSYPYSQQENAVEAQVRKFKNAARAAILDNPLTNHSEWHNLYPLVIIRLNTMVSKYGASREVMHFQDILETQLPLITDFQCHDELEKDLNFQADKFRGAIAKFLHNKQKTKSSYKEGIKYPYLLHELVMRKIHNPASALHPTYAGPYRVIELHSQGATLKDPKYGEILSVHYRDLRKLSIDEFITLLPNNFDADILKNLGMYRYSKNHLPDPRNIPPREPEQTERPLQENVPDCIDEINIDAPASRQENLPTLKHALSEVQNEIDLQEKEPPLRPSPFDTFSGLNERKLRSGKTISINTFTLPGKYRNDSKYSFWSYVKRTTNQTPKRSCLTRSLTVQRTPYAEIEQKIADTCYTYHSTLDRVPHPENYFKSKYRSKFQSPLPGYLTIQLDIAGRNSKKVQFKEVCVKFY
jgi:dUTPase